ncbi:MAG: hypothetical protein A3J63_01505 [Candidatus Moranbacteria bacterium RIFCSPHIGHO2_02_FULL_40_12b]|nr:MAG: hypothetical protein A3J63_01505 [Candidatus Moranbacteria bacterium RIFCSPHIGHO2_02_FULL_40_12b]
MPKKRILKQMFDVRPVDEAGGLDWKKIKNVEKLARNHKMRIELGFFGEPNIYVLGKNFKSSEVPFYYVIPEEVLERIKYEKLRNFSYSDIKKEKKLPEKSAREVLFFSAFRNRIRRTPLNALIYFSGSVALVALAIGALGYVGKGLSIKSSVMGVSSEGYENLASAVENLKIREFQKSSEDFQSAYGNFSKTSKDIGEMGNFFVDIARFFPVVSQVSAGKNLAEGGKNLSLAGKSLNNIIETLEALKEPENIGNENRTLLDVFYSMEDELKTAAARLDDAGIYLSRIKLDDVPEDKKMKFIGAKEKIPVISETIKDFLKNSRIIVDLLGGNGPRKYLFLFQNNQEMRATGGFIGSYGLLDISSGKVRKFFIDGIFNPDGQLKEKIVPPKPIQKISAAWSLHDSNWFPDFPKSARKAILFYEKTGGPTADGIITLTPTVMRKLLEITGPIEMPEYDVTLDAENFIEKTQNEIEADFDKEKNEPKKILSDLAPIVLDKLFSSRDINTVAKTMNVLIDSLNQKQILLYSSNEELQKIISDRNWSGEIMDAPKDYLSVINTNINGYKTDGVVDEKIEHEAEILDDGSVIDTLTITRHHNGGNFSYDWWNKVNADYMRVYVPKNSKLLETEGQTKEFNDSPLDYDVLRFRRDPDVENEEKKMSVNPGTGVGTYEDSGKTVFANWVYVSPQETVAVKYKYLLPFKIEINDADKPADTYSLLAQKQSGSAGSKLISSVKFPEKFKINWKYPDEIREAGNEIKIDTDLVNDKLIGAAFVKK